MQYKSDDSFMLIDVHVHSFQEFQEFSFSRLLVEMAS